MPPLDLQLDLAAEPAYADQLDTELLYRAVERALAAEGVEGAVEITLVLTDDDEIRALNAEHRGVDEPTDVLSFPLEGSGSDESTAFVTPPDLARHLGDVVISFPRAGAQAGEYGHSLRRELAYLTVHGTLHLLGYDHEDEAERAVMRAKEETALVEAPREG